MYLSAFESEALTRSNGIRAGRRVAPAPIRQGSGTKHAYREGDTETLCGRDLEALHPWPSVPFGNMGQHCRVCMPASGLFEGSE